MWRPWWASCWAWPSPRRGTWPPLHPRLRSAADFPDWWWGGGCHVTWCIHSIWPCQILSITFCPHFFSLFASSLCEGHPRRQPPFLTSEAASSGVLLAESPPPRPWRGRSSSFSRARMAARQSFVILAVERFCSASWWEWGGGGESRDIWG